MRAAPLRAGHCDERAVFPCRAFYSNGCACLDWADLWDEQVGAHGTFLVLGGLYIGMMDEQVLGYQAPLHGRRLQAAGSLVLDIRGVLHHEPWLLVMEDLRESRNYFLVLGTVA